MTCARFLRSTATVVALLATLNGGVMAADADARTPLERYRGDTVYGLTICRLTIRVALARMELGETAAEASSDGNGTDGHGDWRTCIAEQRSKSPLLLQAASKAAKKPAVRDALKSYHVIYVAALQGIAPGDRERKVDYAQRQVLTDTRLDEAWARVEVEQ